MLITKSSEIIIKLNGITLIRIEVKYNYILFCLFSYRNFLRHTCTRFNYQTIIICNLVLKLTPVRITVRNVVHKSDLTGQAKNTVRQYLLCKKLSYRTCIPNQRRKSSAVQNQYHNRSVSR